MDGDVRSNILHYFLRTGKMPVPQRMNFLLVGWASSPPGHEQASLACSTNSEFSACGVGF